MQVDDIPIQKGQWLNKALIAKNKNYKTIPTNVIIDKVLPGLGATHMEIISHRHSIIIEPNVPVILGKTKEHKDVLAVWDKCTSNKIKKHLNNKDIKYKKLITTPEGYKKIREVIDDGHKYIYEDYFILFDECEKITQDHDYRPNISTPLNDFFNKFKNKAFVSATPLEFSDPRFEEQNFRILKVVPQYDYKKDINLIVTNDYQKELIKYFDAHKNSDCICVFLNKTNSINSVVNTLGISDQSKIFCSKDSVVKLKGLAFKEIHENLDLPLAKYNFFTSRFYSAIDIKLATTQTPDILILTDNNSYTRVDPATESIQIYGRFRNGFKSLTHIATYNENIKILDDIDIKKSLEVMKQSYDAVSGLGQNYMFDFSSIPNNTIREQLKKLDYSRYLDENNQLNWFAVDNIYYDNKVNSYYKSIDALKTAYDDTNHFNIKYTYSIYTDTLNILKLKDIPSIIERRNEIVNQLDKIEKDLANRIITQNDKNLYIDILNKIDDFIVEFYYALPIGKISLGKAVIEKLKYNNSRMQILYEKYKIEKYRLSKEVKQEIFDNFQSREGTPILQATIKAEIEKIYKRLGIIHRVTLTTIEDYYDHLAKSGSKRTYTLTNRKI